MQTHCKSCSVVRRMGDQPPGAKPKLEEKDSYTLADVIRVAPGITRLPADAIFPRTEESSEVIPADTFHTSTPQPKGKLIN